MFNISALGTREGVIKKIRELKPIPETDKDSQIDAARAFMVAEVNSLPDEYNGCHVHAEGVTHQNGRTFTLNIIPHRLHVEENASKK